MTKKKDFISNEFSEESFISNYNDFDIRVFLNDFLSYSRYLEETRAIFASFADITASQYMILITIQQFSSSQPPGINEIASHLHYSSAFVTIEVNQLVKRDLLSKIQNPNDLRRVLLRLTDQGNVLLEQLAELQRPVNDVLFGSLNENSFQQLRNIIHNLAKDGEKALKFANYIHEQKKNSNKDPENLIY